MQRKTLFPLLLAAAHCLTVALPAHTFASPLDTVFTYQGELKQSGVLANGTYHLRFQLWDALSAGSQVGTDINVPAQSIVDGRFTTPLDFGAAAFNGDARWLQVQVITNGGATVTTLVPRQPITAAPYSLQTRGIFVDASNRVGVGTLTPVAALDVARDWDGTHGALNVIGDKPTIRFINDQLPTSSWIQHMGDGDLAFFYLNNQSNWQPVLTMTPFSGNVGIGTATPSQKLHVNGSIQASCGVLTCSDARFKENIIPLEGAIETIARLQPVFFEWKQPEFPDRQFPAGEQIGFIAQDMERVVPSVVSTGSDGYKSVDYGRLTPVLVQAINDLRAEKDAEIEMKDAEIAALRAANLEINERLQQIESALAQLFSAKSEGPTR